MSYESYEIAPEQTRTHTGLRRLGKISLLCAAMLGASASQAADYSLMMATTTPEGSPWGSTLSTFEKLAEQYTNNKVDIKISFGGALGNDTQLLQKAQLGSTVQGAQSSGAQLGSVVPVIRSFDVPYIVDNVDDAMGIFYKEGHLQGKLVDDLQALMAKKNLRLLYATPFEFRGLLTSKPVVKPADMDGMKFRVTPSRVERGMISDLGAGANTLGISEVYTALQTGTVDGLAIPPITAVSFALQEVGKNFNMLNFQPHPSFMLVNARTWNKLPKDVQEQVQKAADDAVAQTRGNFDKALTDAIAKMKANGVTVHEPSAEEKAAFAAKITDSAVKTATDGFNDDETAFFEALKASLKK
ncbi:TRAP transporter substrate-binding protein [Pokkaliibacter sp. CJK22405]|uniref:TRAP transporter substrate-binding protein n=1 Tax=Pokkaliibacter sp. CJK22405 TaxID=3384615 RepID=UPI003984A005